MDVFHYIYAELMGHWDYSMILPQKSHRTLAMRIVSDMMTLIPTQVHALLEKASSILIELPLVPTNPYDTIRSSSLEENEASLKQKMSNLVSRLATISINRDPGKAAGKRANTFDCCKIKKQPGP